MRAVLLNRNLVIFRIYCNFAAFRNIKIVRFHLLNNSVYLCNKWNPKNPIIDKHGTASIIRLWSNLFYFNFCGKWYIRGTITWVQHRSGCNVRPKIKRPISPIHIITLGFFILVFINLLPNEPHWYKSNGLVVQGD